MIKVGITGQSGFIGTHLYNYLGLQKDIKRIEFKDEFFEHHHTLDKFIKSCDVIVHLAAMNRHGDSQVIYDTNINLVQQLIDSLKRTKLNPHIIMSSSTQEERDNPYGKSKKEGRKLLIEWAKNNGSKFTGLIIPNVFGPFGKPFYNSVVSTFSYQITHEEKPEVQIDAEMKLIYINDLVNKIYQIIIEKEYEFEYFVKHKATVKVTKILTTLLEYKESYIDKGIFPKLYDYFELCLFNTFRSYLPADYFPRNLILHTDDRGSFVETVKTMNGGQFSFSTTKPGITRGNHFHRRKVERFCVVEGEAVIRIRKIGTNKIMEYQVTGEQPSVIDIPIFYTHNITNIGKKELYTLFWINEIFNPDDADTYYEEV